MNTKQTISRYMSEIGTKGGAASSHEHHVEAGRRGAAARWDETWRPVVGYEGLYEVSDLGRVRSVTSDGRQRRRRLGRVLKQGNAPHGYKTVGLSKGSAGVETLTVHCLVLTAFTGPKPTGKETRHLDGDPGNNTLGNLAWGTRSENSQDTVRHGRWKNPRSIGEDHHLAKLTEAQVREIVDSPLPRYILARRFGVNWSTIDRVKKRVTWRHLPR